MNLNGLVKFKMVAAQGSIRFFGREGDFRIGAIVENIGRKWQVTDSTRVLGEQDPNYAYVASVVPTDGL